MEPRSWAAPHPCGARATIERRRPPATQHSSIADAAGRHRRCPRGAPRAPGSAALERGWPVYGLAAALLAADEVLRCVGRRLDLAPAGRGVGRNLALDDA